MMRRALVLLIASACTPTPDPQQNPTSPVVSVATAEPTGTTLAPEPKVFTPKGELGDIVTVPKSKSSPRVDARALVWRARPDETLTLALRYGPPLQPMKDERAFGDSDGHLTQLIVELTSPTGQKTRRTATFTASTRPAAVNFWPVRTLFIEIAAAGVRVKWPNETTAPWNEGAIERNENGVWRVGVTSVIKLPNEKLELTLGSGLVPFDVQPHHPRRRDMMAAAEPERVKAGASNRHEPSVEGGFVYDTLIQLDDDRWVTRFAKPAVWAFSLTSVHLSPESRVLTTETLEISTCIAETMRIDTPSGMRAVEDLRPGDAVWGWSASERRRVVTHVLGTVAYPGRATVWHRGLQMSPAHPVWFDGAWRAAGELPEIGLGQRATVYAVTVGEPHTFFAEGVLVHNKDRAWSPNLDDPWVFMWAPKKEWWK